MVLTDKYEKTYEIDFQRTEKLIKDINETIGYSKDLAESIIHIQIEVEDIKTQILSAKLIMASINVGTSTTLDNIRLPATVGDAVKDLNSNINRLNSFTKDYMETFDVFMKMIDLLRNTRLAYNVKVKDLTASWEYCEYDQQKILPDLFFKGTFEEPHLIQSEERPVRFSSQEEDQKRINRVVKRAVLTTSQMQKVSAEIEKKKASEISEGINNPIEVEGAIAEDDEIIPEFIADENQEVENAEKGMADTEQQYVVKIQGEPTTEEPKKLSVIAQVLIEEKSLKQVSEESEVESKDVIEEKIVDKSKQGAISKDTSRDLVKKKDKTTIDTQTEELQTNVEQQKQDKELVKLEAERKRREFGRAELKAVIELQETSKELGRDRKRWSEPPKHSSSKLPEKSTAEQPTKKEDKKKTESKVTPKNEPKGGPKSTGAIKKNTK